MSLACLLLMALGMESQALPQVTAEYDTLENQVLLSGTAEPDTQISFSVYTYNEKEKTTILYQGEGQTGAGGLYQITVPLPVLGRQYVRIRIGEQENTYAYTRYRKQLASDLRDYYLNVYQLMSGETE